MSDTLDRLLATIAERQAHPRPDSYTCKLLAGGPARAARKVGEEAVEVVVAALSEEDNRLVEEAADLVYHLLVLLSSRSVPWERVLAELDRRAH